MAARRIYVPEAQPSRDANGRSLPAKLRFYTPGSAMDTLKPVYTDDTLTVAHAQPVLSNAAGQFPEIWADDAQTFDVGWYDQAFGRQLGVYENVTPATYVADSGELDLKLDVDLGNLGTKATTYEGRLRFGNQSGWPESTFLYTESIAQVVSVAEGGTPGGNIRSVGLLGVSRSSDYAQAGAMGSIGIYGLALNDNTTNVQIGYACYTEATRLAGAGRTHSIEAGIINKGSVGDINPHDFSTGALTAGLWVSAGRPDVGTNNNVSCALGILDNGSKFRKGIVFSENSLDSSSNVALATPSAHKWAWYSPSGAIWSELAGDHQWGHVQGNTAATGFEQHYLRSRTGDAASQSGDVLGAEIFKGWNASAFVQLGYVKVTQTGAWSGGFAPASMEFAVGDGLGGGTAIALTPSTFGPAALFDNVIALGSASLRFKDAYAKQLRPGDGSPIWTSGAGTPQGAVAAPVGSLYTRTDGGASTTLYVKESGSGNTGWVAK